MLGRAAPALPSVRGRQRLCVLYYIDEMTVPTCGHTSDLLEQIWRSPRFREARSPAVVIAGDESRLLFLMSAFD